MSSSRIRRRALALGAALVLLLAACSDDQADFATSAEPLPEVDNGVTRAGEGEAEAEAEADDDSAPGTEAGSVPSDERPADAAADPAAPAGSAFAVSLFVGRDIVFTADVVVESDDVARATSDAISAVVRNGGAIWGQDSHTDPTPRTVLTIRVPPGAPFEQVLDSIGGLDGAHLVAQSVTTDDVTDVVIDLDARIVAAEAGVQRIQDRLDATTDLDAIFTLEEELATRQGDLERLRGQRKTIGDQITLATITLTIVELDPDRLEPEMAVVAWIGEDLDSACPGGSDLSMGADDTAVLCVNISNTGEDTLTELDIQSPTFRLRVDDFSSHQGGAVIDSLAPGEEILAYAELDATDGFIRRVDASRTVRIDVEVTAVPETSPSVELAGADSVLISADGDDPLPSFADSFAKGWGAMVTVVGVAMVGLGIVLPFAPFILFAAWMSRREAARRRTRSSAGAATMTTPPG